MSHFHVFFSEPHIMQFINRKSAEIFSFKFMATESTANVSYIPTCEIIFLVLGAFSKIVLLYLSVRPPVWKNWTSIGGFS